MLNGSARTPEGKQAYIKLAREVDPPVHHKQYDELYDFFGEGASHPVDPNGGLYPEVYVANMKSVVTEKTSTLMLEKLVDARFVNQYRRQRLVRCDDQQERRLSA
jgi:hypothetical protein